MGIPSVNTVTAKFCYALGSSAGQLIAELPVTDLSMTLAMNGAGPWRCSLPVEDPRVAALGWRLATIPYQTAMWLDINGVLIGGGPVLGRKYTLSQQAVKLNGAEPGCYFANRLQAQDYANYTDANGNEWASGGAPAIEIGYTLMYDALNTTSTTGGALSPYNAYSLPITLVQDGTAAAADYVTATFPLTQRQTIQSMLTQLTGMSYQVGFDWIHTPTYVGGLPSMICALYYPRVGLAAGASTARIDLAAVLDFEYDEDASVMSNGIVEMLGASGGVSSENYTAASFATGWPLLEQVVSHASFSPAQLPAAVLAAFLAADLAQYSYPVTVATVTLPLFNSMLPLGSFTIGQDVELNVYGAAGSQAPTNPRFPKGLSYWFRIVRCDINIPSYGVPTMALTLNIPPNTTPIQPPSP
jgi:hypothetical protein